MTYICHDSAKTTAVIDVKGWMNRIAGWMSSAPSSHLIDPRNEHLLRDIGMTVADNPAAFKSAPTTNLLPYSTTGNNIDFIDLFLFEHLGRGSR